MLDLTNVKNCSFEHINNKIFDLAIVATGYESRSRFLFENIDHKKLDHILVLGFDEHRENDVRKKNDIFYEKFGCEIFIASSNEERKIYSKLIEIFEVFENRDELSILLDYTSMARIWYAGVLNFLRLQTGKKINVYLNYSLGKYKDKLLDYNYSSINSVPFHEGTLSSNTKTLLILAIGFSPYLIKSVIEEIEPNYIVGVLPIPNLEEKYEKMSIKIKNDILTKDIDEWVRCPIDNLESIFSTYADITNSSLSNRDILFLSLGPKIFSLASLLVSQRFPQVTCLYLRSSNKQESDVVANGNFICNHITYCGT